MTIYNKIDKFITKLFIEEQENNRSNNHFIEYNNETHTISEWAKIIGMSYNTLLNRINHGWTIERALTEPIHNNRGNKKRI